jgi:urease accessory protein
LRLAFERRGGATILSRCRYKLPLQVLSPLALDDGTSYLLLLNPTGGVLGGDHLRTEITLEEGARVCLSTPSATRIYRTRAAAAEIDTRLRVARNATLEYLPDHIIFHPGSSLRQSLRVEMSEGSGGILLDNFAAGRATLDEQWIFRDYDSRTEVFLRGKPIYLNRTRVTPVTIVPSAAPASNLCQLAARRSPLPDCSYSGTLLVVADQFPDWRPVVASLRAELEAAPGVRGGTSLLTSSGCSARYLAKSAIAFHSVTARLWTAARREVFHLPPLDLRKY